MEVKGGGVMSSIILDELRTSLTQDFSLLKRTQVTAIRPNLYLHNDPSGTFTLAIKNGSDTIASSTLTMAEIITNAGFSAGQYHWGIFRFDFDEITLNKSVTYTLELSTSAAFDESSYLGWIKEYTNNKNTLTDSVENDFERDYSFELIGYV